MTSGLHLNELGSDFQEAQRWLFAVQQAHDDFNLPGFSRYIDGDSGDGGGGGHSGKSIGGSEVCGSGSTRIPKQDDVDSGSWEVIDNTSPADMQSAENGRQINSSKASFMPFSKIAGVATAAAKSVTAAAGKTVTNVAASAVAAAHAVEGAVIDAAHSQNSPAPALSAAVGSSPSKHTSSEVDNLDLPDFSQFLDSKTEVEDGQENNADTTVATPELEGTTHPKIGTAVAIAPGAQESAPSPATTKVQTMSFDAFTT
jgi:hypothetical protein